MKLFKKLLTAMLVCAFALTVLTGCEVTTDPDAVYPSDEVEDIVIALNNGAANRGLPQLTYSVKYSEVTQKLLENYLTNQENSDKLKQGRDSILSELESNVHIIISDENVKPTPKAGYNYTTLYGTGTYVQADKVGVALYDTDTGVRYLLICTFAVE